MNKHAAAGLNVSKWARRIWQPAVVSLKNKIVMLACACALLSALLVGGINYYRIEAIVLDASVETLAGETRLMAQRFRFSYDQMKSDVQVLSQTPPIQGIARSTMNGGVDPLDGASTKVWQQWLGTTFASMMAARPDYVQLRYIGLKDQGRELVRTNRLASGIEIVADAALQQKAEEPYFQAGLATPRNGVHFSEVTYNRERGALDSALVPTVRVVMPIFDESGTIFGMIVINADYSEMLRRAFVEISPKDNTFVLNNSGDYMEYTGDGAIGRFEFRDNYSAPPPLFVDQILKTRLDEEAFVSDSDVSYFVRLNIDPDNPDAFLGVVVRVPYAELMSSAFQARRDSLVWGGVLVLCCFAASLVMARSFTAPLNRLTAEIKHSSGHKKLENLPLERGDEIGELARAFDQKTRALATKEAKLTAIVDNTVDGLFTTDAQGTVETFNRACEGIFGYKANEVIGRNVTMLMPAPYLGAHQGTLEQDQGLGEREVEGSRKDASEVPLDLSVSEVNIGDRIIYSSIVRDISERKRMDIMKDEFISTVNHELRTPLTAIQGSLGLLMALSGNNADTKSQKLLRLSYDSCLRLSRLVNDILDMEKIAAGKLDYQLEVVEVCHLVAEVVERQQSFAEKYGVEFGLRFDVTEAYVNLDQDRFDQALVNLLSNAAKFSEYGDKVEVRVSVNSNSNVEVSVCDCGSGIPEAFRSKIFGKFAQADGSATRIKGGSGLGLNITKKIIEAFDGTVTFESEEGVGSTFTFTLPACPARKMRA
ncbi:PAS domain S-box [Hoeflea sp. IMCC20628]|uniref:ATP-binding protein n=1 Tax=Hoeflea sp. IMCC20628 TaxID=1620421 RepID=UPI00063B0531|nr:ATP-binding protein [Hoeflea sp. IMCC20628]AKI01035.1 PAS domain S-box [Hoeflea sp. IMCC20628]